MNELALLTKHHKAGTVSNALCRAGFQVRTVDSFDTDQLGTFTREYDRRGSQLDAAFAKAKLATELSQCRFGLGSEGAFGPDPYLGMSGWGTEVLAWWDAAEEHGIRAIVQGPETNYAQATVATLDAGLEFASRVGFPGHGVILGRPGEPWFDKELADLDAFSHGLAQALKHGPVWLETDMRAHRNPTRMSMIARCADALSERLLDPCPQCRRLGFGPIGVIAGALCQCCNKPTSAPRALRMSCGACLYEAEKSLQAVVSASRCDSCNP